MVASRHARARFGSRTPVSKATVGARVPDAGGRAAAQQQQRGSREEDFDGYMRQLKQRRVASTTTATSKAAPSFGEEAFWARVDANISDAKRKSHMPAASDKTPSQAETRARQAKRKSAKEKMPEVEVAPKRKAESVSAWHGLGTSLDAAQQAAQARRTGSATSRARLTQGTKSAASKVRAPKQKAAAEEWTPPRLLPRPRLPVEPVKPEPARAPAFEMSPPAPEVPPAGDLPKRDVVDVEATVLELEKLAEVLEAPAPSAPSAPSAPARVPARVPAGDVEATVRELMKLAEVVEASDLNDEEPYPVLAHAERKVKDWESQYQHGFHEAEGGEEEAHKDDEILSDVEGDGDRPWPWPSGADLDDIPLLS